MWARRQTKNPCLLRGPTRTEKKWCSWTHKMDWRVRNNSGLQSWFVDACRPVFRKYCLWILLFLNSFKLFFVWMNADRPAEIFFTFLLHQVYFTPAISCFLLFPKWSACLLESTLKSTNMEFSEESKRDDSWYQLWSRADKLSSILFVCIFD